MVVCPSFLLHLALVEAFIAVTGSIFHAGLSKGKCIAIPKQVGLCRTYRWYVQGRENRCRSGKELSILSAAGLGYTVPCVQDKFILEMQWAAERWR